MTTNTRVMLAAVVAVTMMAAPAMAQTSGEKLEMTAFAVNMSNIATGANNSVNLKVDAWSTAEERDDARSPRSSRRAPRPC